MAVLILVASPLVTASPATSATAADAVGDPVSPVPLPADTTSPQVGVSDGGAYFVSPLTGASYRILKEDGTRTYRATPAGETFASVQAVLASESRGLPPWALVVEPSLRAAIAEGAQGDATVIIEIRDDAFSRAASAAWGEASADLTALESRISLAAAASPGRRVALGQLDALMDATRRDIYARAQCDLAPRLADVRGAVRSLGGEVLGDTPVLPAAFARAPLASIPALAVQPWVRWISESRSLHAVMDVSAYAIGADTWWSNGYTGGTWDAAVMDTGIDPLHPALTVGQAGVFHAVGQTRGWYGDQPTNPDDLHSHGTHVAGTVASADSRYRGVAYGLDQLINVKAGWLTTGGGGQMEDADAMDGVDWAVGTAGADIISLSFGGGPGSGDTAFERFFDAVVDELLVGVAIAAGNSGPALRTVLEPGAGINIVTAGAMADGNTASRMDDAIASFSSRGPTGDGRLKPDIVAPGVDIMSSYAFWEGGNPDFVSFSGTSMATPHVAASMILLLDFLGTASPLKVKALLLNSAEDRGTAGADTTFGWGYEDLTRAYATRFTVYEGTVTDGPVHYVFYRGSVTTGAKATMVWNRHADYIGSNYPTVIWPLNDLDLLSYNEADNARISASMRTVDNVEQVVSSGAYASYVVKVHVPGSLSGVTQERYGLAADQALTAVAPPSLSIALSAPPTAEVGSAFTVSAVVSNAGELAAHNVLATLNLPPGLSLVSGGNPQPLGRIAAAGSAPATWQVRGDALGLASMTADVASVSYEEAFTASGGPVAVDVVDSTPPGSAVDALPAFETVTSFDVTATASDAIAVASVELFFRKDGGPNSSWGTDATAPWLWTFDTTALGGDGIYDFYSVATDTSSNREPEPAGPDATTQVETSPPTSAVDALPTYTTTAAFTVTATASDPGGVSEVSLYYRRPSGSWALLGTLTAGPWSWTFDSVPAGGDGTYEFYTVATDTFGNVEGAPAGMDASTFVDTAPPATTHGLSGNLGGAGWYTSPVTVTLTAFDGAGSGVASTQVRIDGGGWQAYATPFQVTGEGTHAVEVFSTDNAGNLETIQRVDVRVDTVAPATDASLGGTQGTNGWHVSAVTVTLTAVDNDSRVAATSYQLDTDGWLAYGGPVAVAAEGFHSMTFYSVDAAGNVEASRSVAFKIDRTPPVSESTLSGNLGSNDWYVTEPTVAFTATDALSGIASTQVRVDARPWEPYGSVITVAGEGPHTVEYRSVDAAGNVEASRSLTFKTDTLPPEVAIRSPERDARFHASNIAATWIRSDSGSGISSCTIAVDGGAGIDVAGTSRSFAGLADGGHRIALACSDAAGLSANAEVSFSINTDPFSSDGPYGPWLWILIILALAATATMIAIAAAVRRRRRKEEEKPRTSPAAPAQLASPPPPPDPELKVLPPPPPPDDLPPPPE